MAACKLGLSFLLTPVVRLRLGQWDVANGLQQMVVEPTDPVQCGQLDRLACRPRPAAMNQLGLLQPVVRVGRRVVVAVAHAAHRRLELQPGRAQAQLVLACRFMQAN